MSIYLSVENVHFAFGRRPVLRDVNCSMARGEIVSIVGPNGAGKTTLLRCMLALLHPAKGCVRLDDTIITQVPRRIRAVKQGYVPQQSSLAFQLTVVETILLGRKPHMRLGPRQHDLVIVEDLIDYLELRPLAQRPVNELSGGERQKVMLARALAQEPHALFLDEPTAALDIRHQLEVMERLCELAKTQNKLIVLIMHDLELAARYSDRLFLMYNGGIFAAGSPQQVVTEDNLRVVYGVEAEIKPGRFGPKIDLVSAASLSGR
jgi:iron complex transport system ATP-binding protein